MTESFPVLYETWYAATLFLDAGHPRGEVLQRVGLDDDSWASGTKFYSYLHFANMSWVHSAFERETLPHPEDPALYARLISGGTIDPPASADAFTMRARLKGLRRLVEANPRIGPFSDVDWIAGYVGERSFPTIRYVHDGHHVKVQGVPLHTRDGATIEGIDPFTFRPVGDRWFRDETRVYCQGETPTRHFWFVVRGADPDSFEVLNERYARDRTAGYYSTGRRLPTAEPGTFEVVGYYYGRGQKPGFHINESHYAKDSQKVYAYGSPIKDAHAPSFQAIGDEGVYFADINRIYCENKAIEGADRESFTCASEAGQYQAFDKHQPYNHGKPQSVAGSFERWTKFFEAHPELIDTWWHRARARLAAGDVSEPILIGGPYYSDGERIMVRNGGRKGPAFISLDHFDLQSFRHIVDVFAVDRTGLRYFTPGYEKYGREAIKGADPLTFEALGDGWYRDSRQAYYFNADDFFPDLAVVKADMTTFETLGGAYARDTKGLICAGVRKRDILDTSNVVSLGYLYARMGGGILFKGKPVPKLGLLDVMSARALHPSLLIDAGGHMLVGTRYRKPINGVDVESLRFLNRRFAVDKTRAYGLGDTNFVVCAIADRTSVEAAPFDSIRDLDGRIVFSAGEFKRVE